MTKQNTESSEEDRMKELIICKLCHETLEDPIILPCGKTICSKHLLDETNLFKCGLCDNSHDKTVDKFAVNHTVNELLQICDDYVNLNSIDLGPDYKLAKEKLKHLNDLIKESELLVRDPAFYINDYFSKLRNEVDLSKEQLMKDIEQKYEQIINELKEIEQKCTFEAKSKHFKRLDDIIMEEKNKLLDWSLLLKTNLNRESFCEDISNESIQSINELKFEMNECQNDLLDNKQYKFNSFSTKDSVFGELVIIDEIFLGVSLIQTLTGHRQPVKKFTLLQNGNLVSCSADYKIKIWNPTTGTLIKTLNDLTSGINAITFLNNGNLVSGSYEHKIKIWDLTTGEVIQTLTGHTNYIKALTVLPNGNLVSGSADQTIKIWNPTTGALIQTLTGHTMAIYALTVLPNGYLVSGSDDKTIKIWG